MRKCKKFFRKSFKMDACLLLSILIVLTVYNFSFVSHAKNVYELPDEVRCVQSESKMIDDLIKGMKKHKSAFYYYYPGIDKSFLKYKRNGFRDFFDKVSKKNGYLTGILSGYCITICGDSQLYVSIQVCYLTTKKQEKKIDRKVKQIVKQIGKGNRAKKILRAHEYLIKNMRYDNRYYSPYHAFSKGRGMCMAYALAFQRIMQEMQIPCLYVKGNDHAWNMVKIGKYWYNIDVTWDDSYSSYRYFLKCDRDFPGHNRPKSILFKGILKAKRSYPLKSLVSYATILYDC